MNEDKLTKGHKMILGALGVLVGVSLLGFAGLAAQKQSSVAVPYPVYERNPLVTASASATPTLTPRTYLPLSRPTVKAVAPTGAVK